MVAICSAAPLIKQYILCARWRYSQVFRIIPGTVCDYHLKITDLSIYIHKEIYELRM
jgi:hypothetical protein